MDTRPRVRYEHIMCLSDIKVVSDEERQAAPGSSLIFDL